MAHIEVAEHFVLGSAPMCAAIIFSCVSGPLTLWRAARRTLPRPAGRTPVPRLAAWFNVT